MQGQLQVGAIRACSGLEGHRLSEHAMIFGVVVVLLALPVVMAICTVIVSSYRQRRAEARRIVMMVPNLGEFTSTDNQIWVGKVRDLQVILENPGPPTDLQASWVLALLDNLPTVMDMAKRYLQGHGHFLQLDVDANILEAYGLEPLSADAFVLEMVHPADLDGIYRVEFRDGMPTDFGRDD